MLTNNRWDEWVPEERIMKLNEANRVKQAEVNSTITKKKVVKVAVVDPLKESKKRRRESMQDKVTLFHQ